MSDTESTENRKGPSSAFSTVLAPADKHMQEKKIPPERIDASLKILTEIN